MVLGWCLWCRTEREVAVGPSRSDAPVVGICQDCELVAASVLGWIPMADTFTTADLMAEFDLERKRARDIIWSLEERGLIRKAHRGYRRTRRVHSYVGGTTL